MPAVTTLRALLTPASKGENVQLVGALFPRGYVSIIAGQPGCGKTWFELRYAMDVAMGGECIGVAGYHCAEPSRVLILSGETSTAMLNRRAYQLGMSDRLDNVIIYSQQAMSEHNIDMSLTTSYGRKILKELIQEELPDIVFVDSFISFMSGDESSQADISSSLVALNNIAKTNNVAIVIIHHYRKRQQGASNARSMDDVIGSSAITRLAGVVVGLEVDALKSPPVVYAKCVKSWWKPFHTFSFSVCNIGNTDMVELVLNYAVTISGHNALSTSRRKLEEYILSQKGEFTAASIMKSTNYSQGLVSMTLASLRESGRVEIDTVRNRERVYVVVGAKG